MGFNAMEGQIIIAHSIKRENKNKEKKRKIHAKKETDNQQIAPSLWTLNKDW